MALSHHMHQVLYTLYAEGVLKGQIKPSEVEVRKEKARVKQNTRNRRKKRGLE